MHVSALEGEANSTIAIAMVQGWHPGRMLECGITHYLLCIRTEGGVLLDCLVTHYSPDRVTVVAGSIHDSATLIR